MTQREKLSPRLGVLMALMAAVVYGAYPPAIRGVYADGGNASFVVLVTTIAIFKSRCRYNRQAF